MARLKKEFTEITNLTDEQKQRLKTTISEVSEFLTQIDGDKGNIKELLADIEEELNVDKKIVSKLAKTFYKKSFESEKEEFDIFENYYTTILEDSDDR